MEVCQHVYLGFWQLINLRNNRGGNVTINSLNDIDSVIYVGICVLFTLSLALLVASFLCKVLRNFDCENHHEPILNVSDQKNLVHLMKWMDPHGTVQYVHTGTMQRHSNVQFVTQEKEQPLGTQNNIYLCFQLKLFPLTKQV